MSSQPHMPSITTEQRFTRDTMDLSRVIQQGGRMSDAELAAETQSHAALAERAVEAIASSNGRSRTVAIWYAGHQALRALYLENLLEDRVTLRRGINERMAERLGLKAEAQ